MSAQELLGRFRSRLAPGEVYAARPGARGRTRRRGRRVALLASRRARRMAIALIALVAVLGGGWLWLRDSSLVSVQRVTVTGIGGPDAAQIRAALVSAGRTMSTLDVRVDRLRTAVAPYPVVRDVRVSTQFPHGMRIRVIEQIPVATILVAGRMVPVAGDGTLLHDAQAPPSLPVLQLGAPPGGPRVSDATALNAVALLAAAPYPLLAKVTQVSHTAAHGFTVQLRSGPVIYFGDASELAAKWTAATEVLGDPSSAGATYIDVTDPSRPAAGASPQAVAAAGLTPGPASGTTSGSGAVTSGTGAVTSGTGAVTSGTGAVTSGTGGTTAVGAPTNGSTSSSGTAQTTASSATSGG
jgi:cell division protein FtsQ